MRRSLPAALLLAAAALSLNACVTYALPVISQQPGAADPELQRLARQALRYQDPYSQLELGIRYEYGRGVPSIGDSPSHFTRTRRAVLQEDLLWGG